MSQRRRVLVAVLMSAGAGAASAQGAAARPPEPPHAEPPSDDKANPELLKLRERLMNQTAATVLAQLPTFRPLCDAQGYPLVGNITAKVLYAMQPRDLCVHVRALEQLAPPGKGHSATPGTEPGR